VHLRSRPVYVLFDGVKRFRLVRETSVSDSGTVDNYRQLFADGIDGIRRDDTRSEQTRHIPYETYSDERCKTICPRSPFRLVANPTAAVGSRTTREVVGGFTQDLPVTPHESISFGSCAYTYVYARVCARLFARVTGTSALTYCWQT